MVHLAVTSISLAMLLGSAGVLLYKKAGPVELSGLFGSSGLITYSAGRLLFMNPFIGFFRVPYSQ